MKTLSPFSSTACLAFSLALPGLAAAQPYAVGGTTTTEAAKRYDKLVTTKSWLEAFCSEVRGWTQQDDKGVTPLSSACGYLKQESQEKLKSDIGALVKDCAKLEDEDSGLPALTSPTARLDMITKDHWEALTDKLGEIDLDFTGKNSFRGSSNRFYRNCYGLDCSKKENSCSAIVQLVSDARAQFTTDFDNTLGNAVSDSKPKEVPPPH